MATTTTFDLNQAIRQWRNDLAQSPAFQRENLAELESHLRDSIAMLQARELSAEESFLVAAKRMGGGPRLEAEFGRINGKSIWLDRMLWMLIGVQCWGLVYGVTNSLLRGTVFLGLTGYDFATYGQILPAVLFLLAQLLGFTLSLAGCYWVFSRHGSALGAWVSDYLRRRPVWLLVVISAAIVWVFSFWLSFGITLLQSKLVSVDRFGAIASSQMYAFMAGPIAQTLAFLILTMVVARKRLRLVKA
jgi:hypothetical protein